MWNGALARIEARLARIYPAETAAQYAPRVLELARKYEGQLAADPARAEDFAAEDAFLITYGDMVQRPGEPPLATLHHFAQSHLRGALNTIHILPCFPYTSDDGFSVSDYRRIDPALGDWAELQAMAGDFRLMYDFVCNHCSASHEWFQQFLRDEAPGRDYVMTCDPAVDLSAVVRPRPTPVLTEFPTAAGPRHVWTTFSADQIDLDFQNPDLLLEMLDVLLLYFARGAGVIRLDAIAFLWKVPGTGCLHLPETHEVVKLMRDLVELFAPGRILLTETNVPHRENVSYFGDGDEAQMVYQFSLPPLILHGLLTGNAAELTRWAGTLEPPPEGCGYFNFTASHDGIGVRPLEGLVPDSEVTFLCEAVRARGGQVSYRTRPDGSQAPYELNITYFEAVSDPAAPPEANIQRFLLSQAVPLVLQGTPAIYFHSLVATPNWHEGLAQTGRARTLNRRKWNLDELEALLADPATISARVFSAYRRFLELRHAQPAFHPRGAQKVIKLEPGVFAVERTAPKELPGQQILALFNFSPEVIAVPLPAPSQTGRWRRELVTDQPLPSGLPELSLAPHSFLWLSNV
jgi:sucrose phosphorylase